MDVGARVWCKDKCSGDWVAAVVARIDSAGVVTVRIDSTHLEVAFAPAKGSKDCPEVQFMNHTEAADIDNLINLNHLNEPCIMHCLELRFSLDLIYTFTGPFLIAMNPFKHLEIYSSQVLDMYQTYGSMKASGMSDQMRMRPLPPHVYSVADNAYRSMMRSASEDYKNANQSVLISGESGAGKTETTKHILRYLTKISKDTLAPTSAAAARPKAIMDKLLQSNPILEAFGNARTVRNDNSSRFGKFMLLNFNAAGTLVSGSIRTYLLEKVRLCSQQLGERNFHIFYQLMSGSSAEEKSRSGLASTTIKDFYFANQGGVFELGRIDDKQNYADLRKSFKSLAFNAEVQHQVMDIVAAVLHVGQITFVSDVSDAAVVTGSQRVLEHTRQAALLCGVQDKMLVEALTKKTIKSMREVFVKDLSASQAVDVRDSLAKALYSKLFDFLVAAINKEIESADISRTADVGVLDIFGFESFKVNSLEQLCINYANESLQQQFNEYVFINEQREYAEEGIEWSFIEFQSNQVTLDLIELRQKGVFAMVDDECVMPQGTDTKLAGRMYAAFQSSEKFSVSSAQKVAFQFCIHHYAGKVVYSTNNFLDKNKDEIPLETCVLCSSSSNALIARLFELSDESMGGGRATSASPKDKCKAKAVSVSSKFKDQLSELLARIASSEPHYIRCIKSNELSQADLVNRVSVAEQLRYGGVIEAVRVSRSGFPFRMTHDEFISRYKCIANPFRQTNGTSAAAKQSLSKVFCSDLIQAVTDERIPAVHGNGPEEKRKLSAFKRWKGNVSFDESMVKEMQLGKSKVFLRGRAYAALEGRRTRLHSACCVVVQSKYRQWLAKKRVLAMRNRIVWASNYIKRTLRGVSERRKFKALKRRIIKLQSALRGRRIRAQVHAMLDAILEEETLEAELRNEYAIQLQWVMRRLLAIHRCNLFRQFVMLLIDKLREIKAGRDPFANDTDFDASYV